MFGPNEWLVDEMFDRYQEDPSSVSDEWRTLFRERGSTNGGGTGTATSSPRDRGWPE